MMADGRKEEHSFVPEVRDFSMGSCVQNAYTDAYSVCTVRCVLQYSCLLRAELRALLQGLV